jgi:ribosomal RNA assembly protein
MSFEESMKVSVDRIGALIGKDGNVKKSIEEECKVSIEVDSKSGDVMVRLAGSIEEANPFKAVEIINAIGRGFSPQRAFRLLEEGQTLSIVDLREYAGKSRNSLIRIKGRIIGLKGKARRVIEELTGAYISVYGHTVAIIGDIEQIRLAEEAIKMLALGNNHNTVYTMLQRARTKKKLERLKLWEDRTFEETGYL